MDRRNIEREIERTTGRRALKVHEHADFVFIRNSEDAGDIFTNVPHRYVYHAPTGLEWGYRGSGPSDTALNILAEYIPLGEAFRLHHAFKDAFVATLPREGGVIASDEVINWIRDQWQREVR